jgi:hypothetical protein
MQLACGPDQCCCCAPQPVGRHGRWVGHTAGRGDPRDLPRPGEIPTYSCVGGAGSWPVDLTVGGVITVCSILPRARWRPSITARLGCSITTPSWPWHTFRSARTLSQSPKTRSLTALPPSCADSPPPRHPWALMMMHWCVTNLTPRTGCPQDAPGQVSTRPWPAEVLGQGSRGQLRARRVSCLALALCP